MSSRQPCQELQLLVSVRNALETSEALEGGADWIDVKEPNQGALGRAAFGTMRKVVKAVANRRPVSVALGELIDLREPAKLARQVPAGICLAKVGLSGCSAVENWSQQLADVAAALPTGVRLVAVQYADWQFCDAPSPESLRIAALRVGCPALLVDTFDKSAGRLFDFVSASTLGEWFAAAALCGLRCVAAGRLQADDIAAIRTAGAEVMAVRGAACDGGSRSSQICRAKVAHLKEHITSQMA